MNGPPDPAGPAMPDPAGDQLGGEGDDSLNRERIEREAAAVDAEFTSAPGAAPGAPGAAGPGMVPLAINVVEENTALLGMIVQILTPALPFLPLCYPPSTIAAIGAAYTAVEVKHGWNLRRLVSEEGALLMIAGPPTIAAVMHGRAHFARLRAEREAAAAAPGQAPAKPGAGSSPAEAREGNAPQPAPQPGRPAPHPNMTDGVSLHRVL